MKLFSLHTHSCPCVCSSIWCLFTCVSCCMLCSAGLHAQPCVFVPHRNTKSSESSTEEGEVKMQYKDFVWFLLAEEDKTSPRRCVFHYSSVVSTSSPWTLNQQILVLSTSAQSVSSPYTCLPLRDSSQRLETMCNALGFICLCPQY